MNFLPFLKALRAIVCKNQAEPGSDPLRIALFSHILFISMKKVKIQNFFQKFKIGPEISRLKVLPKNGKKTQKCTNGNFEAIFL